MSLLDLTTDINDPDSSNFNNSNLNNINLDQSLPEATFSDKSPIAVNQLDTKLGTDFTNTDNALSAIDSKAAIQSYLQQDEQTHLISTLLFNSPTMSSLPQSYSVLSMRPEDEAMQAASVLGAQNFKHPVILSQSNVLSKRIANAFAEQWRKTTGNTIAPVYYKNSAEMQTNIAAMLAVNKSKSRINQLNTKVSSSVISKPRNRRDVDMIYFVGSPQQARLIKPYIEVNTSEFARTIPIYASSRSHIYRAGSAISKDLKGLTFTQIPWLLKTEQDASLAALHQQLWPTRSDGLLRLFAMGFDSFNLIEHIDLMRQAPYLQHWGQTGVLKLGKSNTLTRSLLWGTYKNNGIETVTFE
jgi:hypothetical protein